MNIKEILVYVLGHSIYKNTIGVLTTEGGGDGAIKKQSFCLLLKLESRYNQFRML